MPMFVGAQFLFGGAQAIIWGEGHGPGMPPRGAGSVYRRVRAFKAEKCNKTLSSVQVYGFWYIFSFFNQISHYWMP